jgi:hypothetical protein
MNVHEDSEILKVKVAEAPVSICSTVDNGTKAGKYFLLTAQRTDSGRELLSCYLCYFLFVDLPGFNNHGHLEVYTTISGTGAWISG